MPRFRSPNRGYRDRLNRQFEQACIKPVEEKPREKDHIDLIIERESNLIQGDVYEAAKKIQNLILWDTDNHVPLGTLIERIKNIKR